MAGPPSGVPPPEVRRPGWPWSSCPRRRGARRRPPPMRWRASASTPMTCSRWNWWTAGASGPIDAVIANSYLDGSTRRRRADADPAKRWPFCTRCATGHWAGRRMIHGSADGLAHLLAVEFLESRERPGAVDGGGTTVHEEGDADRLGGFLRASAVLDRCVGVRGDAPVAFLADGDRQGDELLGPGVKHTRGQRGVMKL